MKHVLSLASCLVVGLPAALYFPAADLSGQFSAHAIRSEAPAHIVRVKRVLLPQQLKISGELLPFEQVEVVSRLAGKVSEVRFKVGDWVTAGTTVAVIRSNDLEDRLARHNASILAAENELRLRERESAEAEKHMISRRELARRDLIPHRDAGEAEAAAETAYAATELARAHLAQQRAMLTQTQALRALTNLRAPISGQVTGRHVDPGATVSEGGAILTLGGLDVLRLGATVSRADALGVNRGAMVRIAGGAWPNQVFEGEVNRIIPAGSDADQSSEIEVRIDNRQRQLRPGMTVEAAIELNAPQDGLLIPRAAVLSGQRSSYVYKLGAGGAVRHPIVTGSALGAEILVLDGLSEGDTVLEDVSVPSAKALKTKEIPTIN
jgi:RND family efflux transporter MFP subunit